MHLTNMECEQGKVIAPPTSRRWEIRNFWRYVHLVTLKKLRNNYYYTEIIKHTMLLHIHQVHKFSRSFEKRTT